MHVRHAGKLRTRTSPPVGEECSGNHPHHHSAQIAVGDNPLPEPSVQCVVFVASHSKHTKLSFTAHGMQIVQGKTNHMPPETCMRYQPPDSGTIIPPRMRSQPLNCRARGAMPQHHSTSNIHAKPACPMQYARPHRLRHKPAPPPHTHGVCQ